MKKIIMMLLILSGLLMASDKCESWGCLSKIEKLYVNASGAIYIGTLADERLANCTPVANVYFTLNASAGNAKQIYSTLLSAFMSNKKVQLRIKEGSSNCQLAYVVVDSTWK